jgi:UDP-glucose 4-epimerase
MSGGERAKRAFVTGASGGIGSVLVERLSEAGWKVIALVRNTSDTSHIGSLAGITVATGDLLDTESLTKLMDGCDTVFHLAAKVHAGPEEPEDSFRRINIEGTRAVANAAAAAGVRSFVLFSTVAVYPESERWLDEHSAVGPSTHYGATKLASEALVLEMKQRMHVAILRLPVVYGPRDRGNIRRLIEAIASRRFVVPGPGSAIKTVVAAANVADAAILVATDDRAAGKTYIVTDTHAPTLMQIVTVIGEALGMRRRPPRIPLALLTATATAADVLQRLTGRSMPISGDQVRKLVTSTRYSGDLIRRELAFTPRVNLREGILEAVDGYMSDSGQRSPGAR